VTTPTPAAACRGASTRWPLPASPRCGRPARRCAACGAAWSVCSRSRRL